MFAETYNSNIIRLVVCLKRDMHSLKWFVLLFSLCMLLLLCVKHIHVCAGITYGIYIKSSNSKRLKTHFGRLSSAGGKPGQYSVKAPQPGRWQLNHSLYWYFSPLDIFTTCSMPLALFKPVQQRYVASREANRFTDWAIRSPGMG